MRLLVRLYHRGVPHESAHRCPVLDLSSSEKPTPNTFKVFSTIPEKIAEGTFQLTNINSHAHDGTWISYTGRIIFPCSIVCETNDFSINL